MVVNATKSTGAGGAAADAMRIEFVCDYSTHGERLQAVSASEFLRMAEEADMLNSVVFDLESAIRTIRRSDPHTAMEIESIAGRIREELSCIETRLDRYQHLLDYQDKEWFDHR